MSGFFTVPEWRMLLEGMGTSDFFFDDGTRIVPRMTWAPPKEFVLQARAMTSPYSEHRELWIPDRLAEFGEVMDETGRIIGIPDSKTWVFFCDDMPGYFWGHRCRYFVFTEEGAVTTIPSKAPPVERPRAPVGFIHDRPGRRHLFNC